MPEYDHSSKNSEKIDDIRLKVPKGLKDKYRAETEKRGISMIQVNMINRKEITKLWRY